MGLFGSTSARHDKTFEVEHSEEEWRRRLTPEQYRVLREHGTERAGASPLDREKRTGTFYCAACEAPLYSSEQKFDSGTGWPSFWRPLDGAVEYWAHVLASIVFDPWISGSAQPKLTGEKLGSIPLPVPPAAERAAILAKCRSTTSALHSLLTKVRDAIDRLKEFRTALISVAVTGKVDVREEVA